MPRARHRPGQRGGHRRRAVAGRQLPGLPAAHAAVDAPHHGLRRPADRGPGRARLDRLAQDHAAQLDRPERRARTSGSRCPRTAQIQVFTTRPDTLFGATFLVLAPEHPLVAATHGRRVAGRRPAAVARSRAARRSRPGRRRGGGRPRTPPATASASDRQRQSEAAKTAVFLGRYAVNPSVGRADADPDLGLRARELRHRRDHGGPRARPAGLRAGDRLALPIAPVVRPGEHGSPSARRDADDPRTWGAAYSGDGQLINSRRLTFRSTAWAPRTRSAGAAVAGNVSGPGARRVILQAAGLAVLPPAVLGRAVPDRLRRDRPADRAARVDAAGRAAADDRLPAAARPTSDEPRAAAVEGTGLRDGRTRPRRRAAPRTAGRPTPCRSGPGRAGTTCATWTRRTTNGSSIRTSSDSGWRAQRTAPGRRRRPLHRGRGARRPAPAVRALLAQGPVRPGTRRRPRSRSSGCTTRATSWRTPSRTRRPLRRRPPRSWSARTGCSTRASPCAGSTARWARA